MRSGRDIGFATNDRLDAGAGCFLVKLNRPEQVPVIGDCDRWHLEFGRFFHQLFHSDSAIQERILSVEMEMNERIAGH